MLDSDKLLSFFVAVSSSEMSAVTSPRALRVWQGGGGERLARPAMMDQGPLIAGRSPSGMGQSPVGAVRSPKGPGRSPRSPWDKRTDLFVMPRTADQEEDVLRSLVSLQSQTDTLSKQYRYMTGFNLSTKRL
jgi:hypothetical protein